MQQTGFSQNKNNLKKKNTMYTENDMKYMVSCFGTKDLYLR